MNTKMFLTMLLTGVLGINGLSSCSDNDAPTPEVQPQMVDASQVSFVLTSCDPKAGLSAGSRMKVYTNLEKIRTDEAIYGDETAILSPDGFTQTSYNPASKLFTGYIYRRGASDKGIGAGKSGVRTYKVVDGKLVENASPYFLSNFGNVGVFGNYAYAMRISEPTLARINADGSGQDITLDAAALAEGDEAPAVSDVVDMGNNQLAVILCYASADKAAVVFTDYDLKLTSKVITDERIGSSYGAWRSVRYAMSGKDNKGNVYVFCGNSNDDSKVGVLRINAGTQMFDATYKFDLLAKTDGYRFRKVYPMGGTKFLIECYATTTEHGNMNASGKLAIVDVEKQTVQWVTGFPTDVAKITIGYGDSYDGNFYLPVSPNTESGHGGGGGRPNGGGHGGGNGGRPNGGGHGGGRPSGSEASTRAEATMLPTLYKIDGNTGAASVVMTFKANEQIKSINILR